MSILKDGLFVSGTALVYETEYINGEPKFLKDINYVSGFINLSTTR